MKHLKKLQQNEKGMVSITITVVFIMVISLTVLGFSQVSRKNSREALDRQLSSQAFYAAEVGVNDARNKIANLEDALQPVPDQTDCKQDAVIAGGVEGGGYTKKNGEVDAANGVYYTCLLVKAKLPNVKLSNVGSGSVVIPLNADTGTLGGPTMTWKPSTSAAGKKLSDCKQPKTDGSQPWTNFPKTSDWGSCPFGVLRIDLTPNNTSTIQSVDAALAGTMTIFVYPSSGNISSPRSVSYYKNGVSGPVNQGLVIPASCNDTTCSLQLSGLDFQKAYLRVRSIYANTQEFQINAQKAAIGGGYAYTFDAQAEIDVTGKAQDVLRRIQVRVSREGGPSRTDFAAFSDYALQTAESICKQFVSSPIIGEDQAGCME